MAKILFPILFLSSFAYGQSVKGYIYDSYTNKCVSDVAIGLLDSAEVIWLGWSDNNGTFTIPNVKSDRYSLGISSNFYDTLYKDIYIRQDTFVNIDIHKFCRYDISLNNKECPKCHKQDKSIPILYGLVMINKRFVRYKKQEYLLGGCKITLCDPHWYCKRDKIKF